MRHWLKALRVLLDISPVLAWLWSTIKYWKRDVIAGIFTIGDAEYITLSAVLATMTIAVNWSFINSLLPSTRFQMLEPEIDQVINFVDKRKDTGESREVLKNQKDSILLLAKLGKFRINIPDNADFILAMLPVLGAMGKVKDLKGARKLRCNENGIYLID